MSCINPYVLPSASLAPDARVFADRQDLMRSLPRGARIAELGTLFGENADFILRELKPEALHLLDISFNLLRGGSCSLTPPDPRPGPDVLANPVVTLHEGDGATTLDSFEADSMDWVYVDGEHSYRSAYRDGKAAMRVAPVVIFNDYCNWSIIERKEYGVMEAANQLLAENPEWEAFALGLQRDGYHDLAIRRQV